MIMEASTANRRLLCLGLFAALLAMPLTASVAAPTVDGERDSVYTLVANSPKDNLLVDATAAPPINDPADSRFKSLDVTGIWAANSGTDLYLYMELPYLDLNTIAGEWAVVFHLGGANDSIQRLGAVPDPYGAVCDFGHTPAANAVLKSNMCGFQHDYDGNQGYAFLNATDMGRTGWDWENSGFLGNGGWTYDTANGLIHGAGGSGGEIVYKAGKGIEVKVPLAAFSVNPANTEVRTPVPGDVIRMQFYDNVRERTDPRYPRGVVDCAPFEPGSRTDPTRGDVTQWASYTLAVPPKLDVSGAQLTNIADLGHITVSFSSALGGGATTPGNYVVTNQSGGAIIPVASAIIDPADDAKVILDLPVPTNTRLLVTANNVTGSNGALVTATKNTATATIGTPVQFNLYDPWGAVSSLGANPNTGQPYKLTLTGDPNSWESSSPPNVPAGKTAGYNEIPVEAVAGEPGHYRTPIVISKAGVIEFKYRVPELPDGGAYDNWNALNPKNRRFFVPATASTVQAAGNASGAFRGVNHMGEPLTVTWTLVDRDDVAKGRPVYLTGEMWHNWSADPAVAVPMLAVAGRPNTYSATLPLPAGWGRDTATKYKYVIKPDPINSPAGTLWDDLNPLGDRWAIFRSPGASTTASITDVLTGSGFVHILRAAAGLDPTPMWSGYYADMDVDQSGSVTPLDAAKSLRAAVVASALPRLRALGTRIVDPSGNEPKLRGINLGGWFVEEMWMTPWVQDPPSGSGYAKVQDHNSLWAVLTQRLGATAARNVRTAYRNAWIQDSDFARIKAAGFNHVRLPFIYDIVDEPDGMDWLRKAVAAANGAGLYVIIDMHGAPGSQNGWDHSGQVGPSLLFSDPANVARGVQVWAAIAQEFGSNPGVLGFDLINEPAGAPDAATLHQVHNQFYLAIRRVAPDSIIIIEDGYKGFGTMPQPSAYGWTNVVYSVHFYNFGATSPQQHIDDLNNDLPALIQTRASRNVPLYIGEFNLEPYNSPSAMTQYTRTLTDNGLAWSLWTYKTVATGGPMGFWGYYSNPSAVNALNPFRDSEATLISKLTQVRTGNLTIPAGLAAALTPPGP